MKTSSKGSRSILAHTPLMTGLVLGALVIPTQAQNSAKGDSLARVSVSIPQAVKAAGVVMLEVAITRVRTPMLRHAGVVVWLDSLEVGRISVMPSGHEQRYQFNIGAAVRRLGLAGATANVEVAIIDRNGGAVSADSALTVSGAHILIR